MGAAGRYGRSHIGGQTLRVLVLALIWHGADDNLALAGVGFRLGNNAALHLLRPGGCPDSGGPLRLNLTAFGEHLLQPLDVVSVRPPHQFPDRTQRQRAVKRVQVVDAVAACRMSDLQEDGLTLQINCQRRIRPRFPEGPELLRIIQRREIYILWVYDSKTFQIVLGLLKKLFSLLLR